MPPKGANLNKPYISYSDILGADYAGEPAGKLLRATLIQQYKAHERVGSNKPFLVTASGHTIEVLVAPLGDKEKLVIANNEPNMAALDAAFKAERASLVAQAKHAKKTVAQLVAQGPRARAENTSSGEMTR